MTMLELVKHLNFAVVVLFTLLYLYQGFYVVVGLVRRRWQDRTSQAACTASPWSYPPATRRGSSGNCWRV